MNGGFHTHRARVRYAETDQMGVVHHASYLLYLEDGRTRLMEERGLSYAEIERQGLGLPVRRIELRYREAALYGDELCIRRHGICLSYALTAPPDVDDVHLGQRLPDALVGGAKALEVVPCAGQLNLGNPEHKLSRRCKQVC